MARPAHRPEPGEVVHGVALSDDVIARVKELALEIHHGEVRIIINAGSPYVDVVGESRERFPC